MSLDPTPAPGSAGGNKIRMVVPRPGAVSSSSVAPSSSQSRFTIERPMPSPEGKVADSEPEPAVSRPRPSSFRWPCRIGLAGGSRSRRRAQAASVARLSAWRSGPTDCKAERAPCLRWTAPIAERRSPCLRPMHHDAAVLRGLQCVQQQVLHDSLQLQLIAFDGQRPRPEHSERDFARRRRAAGLSQSSRRRPAASKRSIFSGLWPGLEPRESSTRSVLSSAPIELDALLQEIAKVLAGRARQPGAWRAEPSCSPAHTDTASVESCAVSLAGASRARPPGPAARAGRIRGRGTRLAASACCRRT